MGIDITENPPEVAWRQFVTDHPAGNIFHTPEMFQVFSRAKGHKPSIWAAVKNGGEILALLLPVAVQFKHIPLPFTTRAVAYGSVLYQNSPIGMEALDHLLKEFKASRTRGKVLFVELRNLYDLSEAQSCLEANGFTYEDHLNFLIDLARPTETVLQGIRPHARKNIRRALSRGEIQTEVLDQRDQLPGYYELLTKTYQAAGVPLAHSSLFEAAFDILQPKGMIRFMMARVKGEPAAISIELLYKGVSYGWYSGFNRNYSAYVPNDILMWHNLIWCVENGFQIYDFGGAGKPDEKYGVRDFKAKFGGALVNYGRNKLILSPTAYKLGEMAYNLGKSLHIWN